MNIDKISYTEAQWWMLHHWDLLDDKLTKHYNKKVIALFCEKTKNIFFADKATGSPIKTIMYSERNKKYKSENNFNCIKNRK